ncbi:hypothetical protein D1864_18190 [Oceanobacillus picturae]|nr:hypothetical protein D1864_18190 [Oceanobacillus picturae]
MSKKANGKPFGLSPNRNSSPPYHWATPFTCLKEGDFFRKYVKKGEETKTFSGLYAGVILSDY